MKRPIIIVFAAAAAIWLALLPLLVGLYLRAWVPDWTAGWPDAEAAEFRAGWFRSVLRWQSADGIELELQARHVPPLKPGLVRIHGWINTPMTPEPVRLDGHLGLTGGWHLQARAAQVVDPGSLAQGARGLELNFAQPAGQPLTLIVRADELGGEQPVDAPALGQLRLMARHHRDEAGAHHLGLDLSLEAENLGTAGLTLSAGPAAPEAVEELFDGLLQWATSPADSFAQRMAVLTIVGAWQQLAAGGMVMRLEQMHFGENTRLAGQWPIRLPQPRIEGAGRTDELINWYTALAVRLGGQRRDQAELQGRAWLITLTQHGLIHLDEQRFRVQIPAAESPPP